MSDSPINLGAAHVACLNEALRQGPLIIERWRSGVFDILNERYTSSIQNIEKRHLQDAMLALHNHQMEISKSFTVALTSAMTSKTQTLLGEKNESPSKHAAAISFDDLELMGDREVQDTVDSARVLQTVAMACEAGLAAFSARLSTAQGFTQVKADKNPLRPEVFSQALLKAVQSLPVDNAVRSLWFTHGGALMGQQVQALYLELNELLIERGVAPAAYRVITNQGFNVLGQANLDSPIGAGKSDSRSSSGFAPLADDSAKLPTIAFPQQEPKRRALLASSSEPIVHQDFGHTLPAALSVLSELEQSGTALAQTKGKAPLPLAHLREQLKREAKSAGQSMAIDVVSLMIEKMANDPRLLAPVQKIIANAEPAFLRLAVADPRFFNDKSHPARNLLETITARSLAFQSEATPGFAEFLQDLQGVAAMLTEEDSSDTQHFAMLLSEFEKKSALRHIAARESHKLTAQALLEATRRDILATQISAEVLERPDFAVGNLIVTAFLTGPWSQVLAKERMAVDADKTGMAKAIFSLTLGELLWSLDAKQTAPHPKRLAKLIPGILERLQAGLLSIDSPPADSQTFFDEVSSVHQHSLNTIGGRGLASAKRAISVKNKQTKSDLNGLFSVGDSAHSIRTKPAPSESAKAEPRFQLTQPFVETSPEEKSTPKRQASHSSSIALKLGAWVELMEGDQWLRAQLTWVSLYKTLFLFTSADGRTHSMTEPLLEYYLLQGLVKVISPDDLVAGAIEGVTRTAKPKSAAGDGKARQNASRF